MSLAETDWPSLGQTIVDADVLVKAKTITGSYDDGAGKTASVVVTWTPWDERYIQGHPSHIDLPPYTFIAITIVPPNGVNHLYPTMIYGGVNTTFEPIMNGDDPPVQEVDDDGFPIFTPIVSGRPGPSITGLTFPANLFDIGCVVALGAPYGARGESVTLSAFCEAVDQPFNAVGAFSLERLVRRGVRWNGRSDVDTNPLVVPVNILTLTRCDRLSANIGGAKVDPPGYTNITILGCRWERTSRVLTFSSADDTLVGGHYMANYPGAHGYAQSDFQIAKVNTGNIIMSEVPDTMGSGLQRAWVDGLELFAVTAETNGTTVFCTSTAGITAGMKFRWATYDPSTPAWTIGTEIVGVVAAVIDSTRLRLVAFPTCYYGTYFAHDGDVTVGGFDENVDVADDGFVGDGWTIAVLN